jgi:type IX secretion system substrate protein
MNRQILLIAFFGLFLGSNTYAQQGCPVGETAIIADFKSIGGGDCVFELEVSFFTGSANNTSISFTVGIEGGPILYTTPCYDHLSSNSAYNVIFSDQALVVPCNSDIEVFYTAYTSPTCNGTPCSPAYPNNVMDLIGSLPIDLVTFVGYEDKFDRVKLEWVTASEEQNDYFTIERSADGRIFEEIGIVEGNGNSSTEKYYSFMDERSLRGENYYRLKQTDLDNTYEYSNVILVENKIDKSTVLTLAPSVVEDEVTLIFNELPKANKLIEVFNQNGVNVINATLAEGEYTLNLDMSTYGPGMYFIRVPIGKEFVVKKFIKVAK